METINSKVLRNIFIAGAKNLEAQKDYVDELNVFPVPDGDTGTNMTLTILSAAREVEKVTSNKMNDYAKAISSGSLRGARGNSGVILSQLFRGFAKGITGVDELDTFVLSESFMKASDTAYKAVMKPKEGTILTVARAIAEKATEVAVDKNNIEEWATEVIAYGNEVLNDTPNMLPVLKEAGVVDSGGQGLMYVLEGALKALLDGKEYKLSDKTELASVHKASTGQIQEADIKFGYCTEFIIDTGDRYTLDQNEENGEELKKYLSEMGDSIVCVADEDLIKIHVHTNEPGTAIQKALEYGPLINMKIDNMRYEHAEKVIKDVEKVLEDEKTSKKMEHKENAFIAVSVGEGMNEIFEGLGVDHVVTGGQTMNPSTEDFIKACNDLNADNIFILPNNKNIILAANQVADIIEDKNVIVIPSKSAPQGISALIAYDASIDAKDNKDNMTEALADVQTGQVTYAVRDTSIDSIKISEGDILGINEGSIAVVEKDIIKAIKKLIDNMIDEDSELLSIYYGEDITSEEVEEIKEYTEEKYEEVEVEVHYGGQPLYYYIVSVE